MKTRQASLHPLLCAALALSLGLSACNAPAATGTAALPTGITGDIAPLPKGPRQPVTSPDPSLALPRLSFAPLFPNASSNFGPGSKGSPGSPESLTGRGGGGGGGGGSEPVTPPSTGASGIPSAVSDISVVEKSSFNGKVFDTSQKPVSGAQVTARSLNSSVPYDAMTSTVGGAYAFNNAPAGVMILITVSLPGKPAQQRVEVLKSNKAGDPNANRFDFGTDGSDSPFGSDAAAIGNPPVIEPVPTPTPLPTPEATTQPGELISPEAQIRAGRLTAGTWRDLDHWEFWLKLVSGHNQAELIKQAQGQDQQPQPSGSPKPDQPTNWGPMLSVWGISPVHRLSIKLRQGEEPAIDVAMVLRDADGDVIGRARTDNRGQADFFAGLFAAEEGPFVIGTEDGRAELHNLYPSAEVPTLMLPAGKASSPNAVDLMLMVDTTGSMGDELEFLKVELVNLLARARERRAGLTWRASVNFYRDQGDEYLVRDYPFSEDFSQLQKNLAAQAASGGGDYPEAVTAALENALNQHAWSQQARARLLFLVLDAPPHHNEAELARLKAQIARARQLGVRVIPVASSGVDKDTEFLMRLLAITTGGEYVFLTDHSGIGNNHLEPTIGDYEVEKLNALLLRLVQTYSD